MKYSWASITKSCTNFGNYLIEENLRHLLKTYGFPRASFAFDAFKEQDQETIEKISQTDFLIIPGCTTLDLTIYYGLRITDRLSAPIFNIAAAFVDFPKKDFFGFYRNFSKPIAVRDPISQSYLTKNGFESIFIGCPTLFSGNATSLRRKKTNKVLFFLGFKEIESQLELIKVLAKQYDLRVVFQERSHQYHFKNLNVKTILYRPKTIVREINQARIVITSRLHGALPAIAGGTPVFFIKTFEDCRFSLLKWLGIKIFDLKDPNLINKIKKAYQNPIDINSKNLYQNVWILKKRTIKYLKQIKTKSGF